MIFLRFLLVGGVGFLIDIGLTQLLITSDVSAVIARLPALATSMLFTWLANRHFTFAVNTGRTFSEAVRYVVVALFFATTNYGVYFFLVMNGLMPAIAVMLATAAQIFFSFLGYRHIVFGGRGQS